MQLGSNAKFRGNLVGPESSVDSRRRIARRGIFGLDLRGELSLSLSLSFLHVWSSARLSLRLAVAIALWEVMRKRCYACVHARA